MMRSLPRIKRYFPALVLLLSVTCIYCQAEANSLKKKPKVMQKHITLTLSNKKAVTYRIKLKYVTKKQLKKAKWSSSNRKTATVSQTGKVRALKAGKTVITVRLGKKKLKCYITVKKAKSKSSDSKKKPQSDEHSRTENAAAVKSDESKSGSAETSGLQSQYTYTEEKLFVLEELSQSAVRTTERYFDHSDGSMNSNEAADRVLGIDAWRIGGIDYLIRTDQATLSNMTNISLMPLLDTIRGITQSDKVDVIFLTSLEENVAAVAGDLISNNDEDQLTVYYPSAGELVQGFFSANRLSAEEIRQLKELYGGTWNSAVLAECYLSWAQAVDSWREEDGMGYWDFFLYGSKNHNYHPEGKTLLPGRMDGGYRTAGMRCVILGSRRVFRRQTAG